MTELIIGSAIISLLHAMLPNHWLPVIAIGKTQSWSRAEALVVTGIAAFTHSLSTVIIGLIVGYFGHRLSLAFETVMLIAAPLLLIVLGFYFIWSHHTHHHFHLNTEKLKSYKTKGAFILALVAAMFFSPCLEISGYFAVAGIEGFDVVILIAILYASMTTLGMILWVWWLYPHILKLDWHGLEHKTGLIAGWTLVVTGIIVFFV